MRKIWKSHLWRLIFGCGCSLVKGGALTNGLPFYQHTNWPREMSFLSSQGYQAFMANLLIGQGHTGFSFLVTFSSIAATLQHFYLLNVLSGWKLVKSTSISHQGSWKHLVASKLAKLKYSRSSKKNWDYLKLTQYSYGGWNSTEINSRGQFGGKCSRVSKKCANLAIKLT